MILRLELDRRINFAMQQNSVPMVNAVRISNNTMDDLRDISLCISARPEFADPWESHIDWIAAGTTYDLETIDLELSPTYLRDLTERTRGQLRATLTRNGQTITESIEPVEILTREEWSGIASLPEILAAFVMPNHPMVEIVLANAATILGKWNEDPSLSGYQSRDPKRIFLMAGAIYTAIQSLDLTYINPPASFELEGQRIRFPDRIVESRMGTCLDLAVLTAGCLEQAGMNPLLILVKGHAFVGTWLQEECFAEPSSDEPLRLRKRVDLGEIAIFDPTLVTSRPLASFNESVRAGKKHLEDPERFHCVIDVRRARAGGIKPIPDRVEATIPSASPKAQVPFDAPTVPESLSLVVPSQQTASPDVEQESPALRLDRWRRRLLDLSLRNRLLNFRETKKTIPLLCADTHVLEDSLAEGTTFRVMPRFEELGAQDPRTAALVQRGTVGPVIEKLLRDELAAGRLRASLKPEELDHRLLELYRAARLSLEEGGASTLYMAIGFLAWYESPQSTQCRLAPILLVPLELRRKSLREGFTLQRGDDDARINVTLLEMLKQDFGITIPGLDPLPEDDHGVDVQGILRYFRQSIRDVERWDVVDRVFIGMFSFAKFLMWRDLDKHAEQLKKSAVVDHLLNHPDEKFDPGGPFPNPDQMDESRSALQTFCPLPSDASQLAAVHAAADGRTFVLEGPPGTGKSQTITNLIAHCLANGKTVLFVAEKRAALNVVFDRLQEVGLAQACLELHSNKAEKQKVLAQLNEALTSTNAYTPEEWEREARRLESLRNELNAYVAALHSRRKLGESVFQVTSKLIGLREVPRVPLSWPSPDSVSPEQLAALRDLIDRLTTTAMALGDLVNHPWSPVRQREWTPAWEEEVASALTHGIDVARTLATEALQIGPRLSMGEGGWSLVDLAAMDEVAGLLVNAPSIPQALVTTPTWDDDKRRIGSWIDHGRQRDLLCAKIDKQFKPEIVNLNLESLEVSCMRAAGSVWPISWWRYRKLLKVLNEVAREGNSIGRTQLEPTLHDLRSMLEHERALLDASASAADLLGPLWQDGSTAWDVVEKATEWVNKTRACALRLAHGEPRRAGMLLASWAHIVDIGQSAMVVDETRRALRAYRHAYDGFTQSQKRLEKILVLDSNSAWGGASEPDVLTRLDRRLNEWTGRVHQLRDWCTWQRFQSEAADTQLTPLIQEFERGRFAATDLRSVFDRSFYQWWHAAVVSSEPVLAHFFSPEHDRKITQFRETDDRYAALTRQIIAARLASRVPRSSTVDLPNSEVGILRRELMRRRRHMSLRRLLQSIPNLLPRLKPCLLMSPISVAQYLDASAAKFDLVVFDEASQVPAWDAVGALGRGKQAVIVGDPKQLPPTSFFTRTEDEESDDTDTMEDLESILDDGISAQLPFKRLNWHYRSRHESLIAFSNYHYYDNSLLTFPSPQQTGLGVSLRPVPDGVYDRGKSATNRAEGQAIVEELVRRLKDPELRKLSYGIVTFSQAQQKLIEDLLEDVRTHDPEIDEFFDEGAREPVFIKNLENVQGDERDVILFSICYGPDITGRVAMNFGPMNRDGGERRLNVAITRARQEVLVFSTLRADQIDLARSRARGVRDLKNFLEYAEKGPSTIAAAATLQADADAESPFEKAVQDALVRKGWEVHNQVGCARYRIDLGVVDPRATGRYLLGIECDGANYHRAKTARDRDKLREGILIGLGWKLHRIWSTDWWLNPDREMEKLTKVLEETMSTPLCTAPTPTPQPKVPKTLSSPPETVTSATPIAARPEPPVPQPSLPRYQPYQGLYSVAQQETFYEPYSISAIQQLIVEVVNAEGPISLRLMARRVSARWGFERVRQKSIGYIERLIPRDQVIVKAYAEGTFLWPRALSPDTYEVFRIPDERNQESQRAVEDLPIEEVANAAIHILNLHVSAPTDEIIREMARIFGFQRVGGTVEKRMRAGLAHLVLHGKAKEQEGRIALSAQPE